MPQPASTVSEKVAARARGLNQWVTRLERLHAEGHLSVPDLHRAYGGAFLSWYTVLERGLERLFLGILAERIAFGPRDVRPLLTVRSDRVAANVATGGRKYADWIPYSQTEERAKAMLSRGLPFSALTNGEKRVFDRASWVRNALAHDSRHARNKFRSEFVLGQGLPASQERPGGYLRGQHAGGQRRLEALMTEGVLVVRLLCSDQILRR